MRAALLGLAPDVYAAELGRLRAGAKEAARELLADPAVGNLAEVRQRVSRETQAQCLWLTPAPVLEDRVSTHWGSSRFGVRFRNEDISRVAELIAAFDGPSIELFTRLGLPPPQDLLMEDGLHFTQVGQKRIALEVVRGWADARAR